MLLPFDLPGACATRLLPGLALVAGLAVGLPGPTAAQIRSASGLPEQIVVRADVRPVFDVLETRRVPGGYQLRVMSNLREQSVNGLRFMLAPGENVLFVPSAGAARPDDVPVTEVLY